MSIGADTLITYLRIVVAATTYPDRYVPGTADSTTLRDLGLVDEITRAAFVQKVQMGVRPKKIDDGDVPVALDTTIQNAASAVKRNVH